MTSVPRGTARSRRRSTAAVKDSLRDLRTQLALLNYRVGTRIELKSVDLDCLELLARLGPLSPSTLARHAGLHPATMTGILDRLERGGWLTRDRDPSDRRAVIINLRRDRNTEIFALYSGMNSALDDICATYPPEHLDLIADFLRRAAQAGNTAAEALAAN